MDGNFYSGLDDFRHYRYLQGWNEEFDEYFFDKYYYPSKKYIEQGDDQINGLYNILYGRVLDQSQEYQANKAIEKMIKGFLSLIDSDHSNILYTSLGNDYYPNFYGQYQYTHILKESGTNETLYIKYDLENKLLKTFLEYSYTGENRPQFIFEVSSKDDVKRCLEKSILTWIVSDKTINYEKSASEIFGGLRV